jgi:hypothetical protein
MDTIAHNNKEIQVAVRSHGTSGRRTKFVIFTPPAGLFAGLAAI